MSADEQNKEAAFMGDSTAVTAGELRENPFLLRALTDSRRCSSVLLRHVERIFGLKNS